MGHIMKLCSKVGREYNQRLENLSSQVTQREEKKIQILPKCKAKSRHKQRERGPCREVGPKVQRVKSQTSQLSRVWG